MAAAAPLAHRPGKIVCVGRNYRLHAAEFGEKVPDEPLIFLKPPSAVIASGEAIRRPPDVGRVDFEGEIGLVCGRRCRRVVPEDAWVHIGGVVAVNDVTSRTLQRGDHQWTRAKGLDTFCPVGNVVPASSVDLGDLNLVVLHNGQERQAAAARDMVFPIPVLVSFISRVMTLEPGDLILTGTPHGVGALEPGDVVRVELSCGSTVTNQVEEALPLGSGA